MMIKSSHIYFSWSDLSLCHYICLFSRYFCCLP